MSEKRIGERLVQKGIVSAADLEQALAAADASGTRLASQLLEHRVATEEAIVEALAQHLEVPGIDLSRSAVDLSALSLIPAEVAEIEHILPLRLSGNELLLAMADPHNARVLEEVRLISGKRLVPHVALSRRLEGVITLAYEAAARGEKLWIGEVLPADTARESLAIRAARATAPPSPRPPAIAIEVGGDAGDEVEIGAVRARPAGRVVLIVDDEDDVLALMRKTVQQLGFRVETARRGDEALARANDLLPDLILLDANLPEQHGFEVCRKLKANPRFKDIPIVLVTGIYRGWRFAQDAREAFGADDYIEKPFRLDELSRAVKHHLGRSVGEPDQHREGAERFHEEGARKLESGQPAEAVAAFEQSAALDPFSARNFYQLARALQAAGDGFRAVTAYERSIALKPDHFAALRSLAVLYQQKGLRRKALETWERAASVAPDEATRERIKASLMALL